MEAAMLLEEERKTIVEFGRKMLTSNLTTGSGGNLSIFNREKGLVAITPSRIEYFKTTPEDVAVMTLEGQIVEGDQKPSSEVYIHLGLYRQRSDANAVVHTHQVYATTLACLNWELPAVHYLVGYSGGKVPLAPYATFGSQELADGILSTIGDYNACLMANHGLVTLGPTIDRAFATAEQIELVSRIYYQAKCIGTPVILSEEQMGEVLKKFTSYRPKNKPA
jgi:L-fuculose-phosphate aldolase